jgi:hypothetical protein
MSDTKRKARSNNPQEHQFHLKEQEDKTKKRAERFAKNSHHATMVQKELEENDIYFMESIVGTSTMLEKPYLRLTGIPHPSTVRPEKVLQKSLSINRKQWKQDNDYKRYCEQLKSIRQDLLIQGIKNSFTVKVYIIHYRTSAQNRDWSEFIQCQTILENLFQALKTTHRDSYVTFLLLKLTGSIFFEDNFNLHRTLKMISTERLIDTPDFGFVLQLHRSLVTSNYERFFRLREQSPPIIKVFLESMVDRIRSAALRSLQKGYGKMGGIDLPSLTTRLGFLKEEEDSCIEFVKGWFDKST